MLQSSTDRWPSQRILEGWSRKHEFGNCKRPPDRKIAWLGKRSNGALVGHGI